MLNKLQLIGHLGKDPELRNTQSGTPVAGFSVATTEKWNDKSGEKQERTEWTNIVAWGKLGENCHRYLGKGSKVYVEGRKQTRKWQDKEGNDRYTVELVANNVLFLDPASKRGGSGDGGYEAPPVDDDVPF